MILKLFRKWWMPSREIVMPAPGPSVPLCAPAIKRPPAKMSDAEMRQAARSILESLREGDRIEAEGLPFYCVRAMQDCSGQHKKAGNCSCDRMDAAAGLKALRKAGVVRG